MSTMTESKLRAAQFLESMAEKLLQSCPPPSQMRERIQELVQKAKATENKTHHSPEYAFLNEFVVPKVFDLLKSMPEFGESDAREAFLSEWFRGMSKFHKRSPARPSANSHPFEKLPRNSSEIVRRWRGQEPNASGGYRKPLHQACPDLAITSPFPKIVFEVKYFRDGENPEVQLVNGLYEAFYYLAMPETPATTGHPAWDYDHGCFIAYDASTNGLLMETWHSLLEETRRGFWVGANIFPLLIRPSEAGG